MSESGRRHHRPAVLPSEVVDSMAGGADPSELVEAAHRTAAAVVDRGRASQDPELTDRLVGLVGELGLSTLAELWADRPARSLPGALWRLYLVHEWVQRQPQEAGRAFTAGAGHAEVYRAIAGLAEPPAPSDLERLTERILTGVFDGDLAVALERAAAFCHVAAIGLADPTDRDLPAAVVRRATRMQDTARDLQACARMWRADTLA